MSPIDARASRSDLLPPGAGQPQPQPGARGRGGEREGGLETALRHSQADVGGETGGLGHFDRFGASEDPEADFLDKVRRAIGDGGRPQKAGGEEPDPDPDARLLAVSERLAPLPLPGVVDDAPAPVDTAGRAALVSDRIEAAVRGEMRPPGNEPLTIRFDTADLAASGIAGVTITLSATALDVTLTRSAPDASQGFLQSAQALADRLQVRFGKRIVRIMEADALPATPSRGGFEGLSALFAKPAADIS